MHTIINPNFVHSSADEIDAMQTAMSGYASRTLDEIRSASALLADKEDGELHQIALDSGYLMGHYD